MLGLIIFMFLVFFFSSHPLVMGLILVLSTIFVSFYVFLILNVGWFSYILFLVLLGGMLVLFIYVASLASNEGMKFEGKFSFLILIFFTLGGIWMVEEKQFVIWKFYFYFPFSIVILFLGIYLLLTLVGVVKITSSEEIGPLREMVYENS